MGNSPTHPQSVTVTVISVCDFCREYFQTYQHVNSKAGVSTGSPLNRNASHIFKNGGKKTFRALEFLVNRESGKEMFLPSTCLQVFKKKSLKIDIDIDRYRYRHISGRRVIMRFKL